MKTYTKNSFKLQQSQRLGQKGLSMAGLKSYNSEDEFQMHAPGGSPLMAFYIRDPRRSETPSLELPLTDEHVLIDGIQHRVKYAQYMRTGMNFRLFSGITIQTTTDADTFYSDDTEPL